MRPYPVSTCPWLNSWPTFPSLWWHPSTSPMADIQYSIYALWCWGPGCYINYSFRIATATLAASHGLPDHLIKTLGRWSSDAYQIYICTPISTIVEVASLLTWQVFLTYPPFLVVFVGCLRTFVVWGQGFPQPWAPLSFSDLACVSSESPLGLEWGLMAGLRRFASHGGSILSRDWLATVEAPGYPGIHLPLKWGSWLNLVKCNLTKLTTTSLAVKRFTSLAVK